MSEAVSGVGASFRRWQEDSGTGHWENFAEVISIKGPGMSKDVIDVTSLDSTDGYREFIGSFKDGGTVTLSMIFTRLWYTKLKLDFEEDELQNYEILLPDGTTEAECTSLEFIGFVTEMPLSIAADDKITMDITIKISGQVAIDMGSGST